ncbi:MAG: hypothetical protein HY681_00335 [Chloroflexi bacterium]|nr:hypothetical protein [Chloroflexota bacterium]
MVLDLRLLVNLDVPSGQDAIPGLEDAAFPELEAVVLPQLPVVLNVGDERLPGLVCPGDPRLLPIGVAARQPAEAPLQGEALGLPGQAGLADARLVGDKEETSLSAGGGLQRGLKRLDLAPSLDKGAGWMHLGRHGPSPFGQRGPPPGWAYSIRKLRHVKEKSSQDTLMMHIIQQWCRGINRKRSTAKSLPTCVPARRDTCATPSSGNFLGTC